MWSFIEYLKRPELVVATQEWFGVEYVDGNELCKHDIHLQTSNEPTNDSASAKRTHRRNVSDESNESMDSQNNDNDDQEQQSRLLENAPNAETTKTSAHHRVRIKNKFWYYLFLIGTELGDEFFYATMIPFWFWNIDGAVGRRVVFVWSIVMYVGQGLKDIIRWPRPGYPVQRLAAKWSIEYGMPSTHAMVSSSNLIETLAK